MWLFADTSTCVRGRSPPPKTVNFAKAWDDVAVPPDRACDPHAAIKWRRSPLTADGSSQGGCAAAGNGRGDVPSSSCGYGLPGRVRALFPVKDDAQSTACGP